MAEQYKNFAETTLNGGINNSTTTVVVTSASTFPSSGNFRIKVENELMLVTNVSSNTFTVTRGIEGTSAAAHDDLVPVKHTLTAGALQQILDDYSIVHGLKYHYADVPPKSPGTYDEEFLGTADTLPTDWAWVSAPSSPNLWKLNSRYPSKLAVELNNDGIYTVNRTSFSPSGDFGLWWKVGCSGFTGVADERNLSVRISNTAESEQRTWQIYNNGTNPRPRALKKVSNIESVWYNTVATGSLGEVQTRFYGGLTRTSGNAWTCWFSDDGITYNRIGTATDSHSFTINKIMLEFGIVTPNASDVPKAVQWIDWLRYRADLDFPRYDT